MIRRVIVVAVLAVAPHPRALSAQLKTPPPYGEYRVDAIVDRASALEVGGGVVLPMGYYVRLGVDGAAGATQRDGMTRASGRVDAIARFALDPFREVPFGLSVGGGVTLPYADGDAHLRPLLAAVVDIEGRMRGRFTPAIEIGLGGGARLGFVLRTSPARWR